MPNKMLALRGNDINFLFTVSLFEKISIMEKMSNLKVLKSHKFT